MISFDDAIFKNLLRQLRLKSNDVLETFLNYMENYQSMPLFVKKKLVAKFPIFKTNVTYMNLLVRIFAENYSVDDEMTNGLYELISESYKNKDILLVKLAVKALYYTNKGLSENSPTVVHLLDMLELEDYKDIESLLLALLDKIKDNPKLNKIRSIKKWNKEFIYANFDKRVVILTEFKNSIKYLSSRTFFLLSKVLANEKRVNDLTENILVIAEKIIDNSGEPGFENLILPNEFRDAICKFMNSIPFKSIEPWIKRVVLKIFYSKPNDEAKWTILDSFEISSKPAKSVLFQTWKKCLNFLNPNGDLEWVFSLKTKLDENLTIRELNLTQFEKEKLLFLLKTTNCHVSNFILEHIFESELLDKHAKFCYTITIWLNFNAGKENVDISHSIAISEIVNKFPLIAFFEEIILLFKRVTINFDFFVEFRSYCELLLKRGIDFYITKDKSIVDMNRRISLSFLGLNNDEVRPFEDIGWSVSSILELKDSSCCLCKKGEFFKKIMKLIFNYSFSPIYKDSLIEIITKSQTPDLALISINRFIISETFTLNGVEFNEDELIEEFKKLNTTNEKLNCIAFIRSALELLNDVRLNVNGTFYSTILADDSKIQQWDESKIESWSKEIKNKNLAADKAYLPEIFAVINRAVKLFTQNKNQDGYGLRKSQILACYALINEDDSGILAEIGTGEGKTTIISVIAVFKCLKNIKVDILSSSYVLARRDAINLKKFYEIFGFTCSENSDSNNHIGYGMKSCYACDIVYGSTENFQYDLLKHEFSMLKTRGDRKFECAIIDEVDSLLIDESSNTAMLSAVIPSMNYLDSIFISIWFYMKKGNDDGKIVELINNDIYNLKLIFVPTNLKDFVEFKLKTWIKNARLVDKNYKEGIQYRISDEKIKIINLNSGVTYEDSRWDEGVHKFLEIKHSLRLTAENMTTNYLSNSDFFLRYIDHSQSTGEVKRNGLIGLTGTLGTQKTKALLDELYKLNFVHIPRHKSNELKSFPLEMYSSQDFSQVVESIRFEIECERAVLVICNTMQAVKYLKNAIDLKSSKWPKLKKLKQYVYGDYTDNYIVKEMMNPGDLILATKLAGRGTDLKISEELKLNGGLHVIITFVPNNKREDDQFTGRTAREGLPGTTQTVIQRVRGNYENKSIYEMISQNEATIIDKYLKKQKKYDDVRRELFQRYCKMRNTLKDEEKDESFFLGEKQKVAKQDSSLYRKSERKNLQIFKLKALDEEWGLWLARVKSSNCEKLIKKYEYFEKNLIQRYHCDTIIKNSIYWLGYANELIKYLNSWIGIGDKLGLEKEINSKIVKALENSIKLEDECGFMSLYLRAYMHLKNEDNTHETFLSCFNDLNRSKENINKHEICHLNNIKEKMTFLKIFNNSFSKKTIKDPAINIQLVHKKNIICRFVGLFLSTASAFA